MKKIRTHINISIFITVLFIMVFIPTNARAADIFWEPNSQELYLQEKFLVTLWFDTQGADINVISGTVVFPEDKLVLQQVQDGNSIINFWVEQPTVTKVEKQGTNATLTFFGVIPGGFNGEKGKIFSMIFETVKSGSGEVKFSNYQAFLNDGSGSTVQLTAGSYKFNIIQELVLDKNLPEIEADIEPPLSFTVEIVQDKTVFDNQHFLVFASQDKGTGIKSYEVAEIPQNLSPEQVLENQSIEWQTASIPYLLNDQSLRSNIYVKATDNAGNSRIEVLPPQQESHWYEVYSTSITISVIMIMGLIIIFIILKKVLFSTIF